MARKTNAEERGGKTKTRRGRYPQLGALYRDARRLILTLDLLPVHRAQVEAAIQRIGREVRALRWGGRSRPVGSAKSTEKALKQLIDTAESMAARHRYFVAGAWRAGKVRSSVEASTHAGRRVQLITGKEVGRGARGIKER